MVSVGLLFVGHGPLCVGSPHFLTAPAYTGDIPTTMEPRYKTLIQAGVIVIVLVILAIA